MHEGEPVGYDQDGHVVTITYNRPDALNAVNGAMREDLNEAWQRFLGDPDAWVAIVTGAGRAFCAGADLVDGAGSDRHLPRHVLGEAHVNCFESGLELFKPVDRRGQRTLHRLRPHRGARSATSSSPANGPPSPFPRCRIGMPTIVGAIRLPRAARLGRRHGAAAASASRSTPSGPSEMGLVWRVVPHDELHGRGPGAGRPTLPGGAARRSGPPRRSRSRTAEHGLDRGGPLRRDDAHGRQRHRRRRASAREATTPTRPPDWTGR